jgi:hypothetical protein
MVFVTRLLLSEAYNSFNLQHFCWLVGELCFAYIYVCFHKFNNKNKLLKLAMTLQEKLNIL